MLTAAAYCTGLSLRVWCLFLVIAFTVETLSVLLQTAQASMIQYQKLEGSTSLHRQEPHPVMTLAGVTGHSFSYRINAPCFRVDRESIHRILEGAGEANKRLNPLKTEVIMIGV